MSKAISTTAACAALLMLAACSPGSADKSGADILLLHLATIDGRIDNSGYQIAPVTFVDALPEVSGNHVRVEVTTAYGDDDVDAESRLVQAVAAGELDGGWPASRAFAAAGIPGLAALEAPMAVTSMAAQRALAEGDAEGLVTDSLEGSGLVGLGLMPGPLRRPFGVDVFPLAPSDWAGLRFRSYHSRVQSDTVTALGATPVDVGTRWPVMAQAGDLDGVELDVAQYNANGYGRQAGKVVSNVVLWPKMSVLVLNRELWDSLTDQQRGWIQDAADQAVQAAIDVQIPEDEIASQLCARGTRFRSADPGELLALRSAVQPVVDGLAQDPHEAPLLHEVESVASRYAPDVVTVQDSCTTEANLPDDSDVPTTVAPIPEGTYRKQISAEEVDEAGLSNNDGTSGTWTLRVADGHWYVLCRPFESPGVDCGKAIDDGILDAGTFYGDERVAWMVHDPALLSEVSGCDLPADDTEGHCAIPQPPARLDWALDGRDLVFRSASLSLGFETILKPFVRID